MFKHRQSILGLILGSSILAIVSPTAYAQSESGGGAVSGVVKDVTGLLVAPTLRTTPSRLAGA